MANLILSAERGDLFAWQQLIDSGDAWRLGAWHSQMAAALIASGDVSSAGLGAAAFDTQGE